MGYDWHVWFIDLRKILKATFKEAFCGYALSEGLYAFSFLPFFLEWGDGGGLAIESPN